jgi:hypothetical protein
MAKKTLRESLKDPNYKGEDYNADEQIEKEGPLRNRKCTDCLFLFILILFIVLMSYISNNSL